MATDKSSRFDNVDWEAVTADSGRALSTNLLGTLLCVVPLIALLVYDFVALGQYEDTFAFVGIGYDVTQLDWLFALSLILFVFYALLPLYQNPRITRYYWREFKRNRPAVVSLAFLTFVFVVGLLGPIFISQPEIDLVTQYQPPIGMSVQNTYPVQCLGEVTSGASGQLCHGSLAHPLGTDSRGRDILVMLIYGMQVTVKIAFITSLIVITIGTAVGTVAAYSGGMIDEVLMRYVDVQQSFPTFIAYLLILYAYGGGLFLFIVLFGTFAWEGTARYVRSNALTKSEDEFMKSAELTGASTYHIITRHLIPNTASSIITILTLLVPGFILAEAQLAFLGLGDPTAPSWGQLLSTGRDALPYAPWITLMPGFLIFLTILAFNFLGDAVLDALNPEAQAESE
ncbi:ABC transporter permease [Halobacteriales archaeon QH_7_65_31]|nr:MAG: ABC transporter permease [Halobacteriales archaeon QH_7_65_31]